MSQLEHILKRPDTYIGSVDKQTQQMWVLDQNENTVVMKQCTFVPGLYKIFDEIIVNAADNKQRDPTMSLIEVTINENENYIRVWNNGNGIPIAIHQEHGIYVPELIFGNLLTGSNFDDNEEKTTGGRNGFGAKLANIFSTKFVVETGDVKRGKKYRQEFTNNMTTRKDPVISNTSSNDTEDFTCITFYPDLARFKMDRLDEDIVALLSKRVYDIAGTNIPRSAKEKKLRVKLNGKMLTANTFEAYVGLYQGIETPVAFERLGDRWEVGVGVSDGSFQQVSYVNSISTTKGGCHVNYIVDQITAKLAGVVKKKNKGEEVKANQIKNHLAVYVNALIVNPAFDSQTKENLTTKAANFGSTCTISDKMMKQIETSGIIDNILSWSKFKQTAELKKKSGTKRSKLVGIPKLDDANCAGTSKSAQCTLILTEGDSAKALAISGLGVVGRDYYGVFPLKGKLLNVREATHAQIMKNEEIQNIAKILGLAFGKTYSEVSSLRYGHLMIMTDQDHDGSHIKGLLINFLHYFWPSLLQIDGFLQQFITPIVKCHRGKKEKTFFTIPEYQRWREENGEGKGWRIKYYKGLGTSTAAEAKEYFSNLPTHEIDFEWDGQADDVIDMAFSKKRVEDRKLWLLSMAAGTHIDYGVDKINYETFVNKELILFSHADNERSIAHFMDGLKPSQRKVLFACFKRNLRQEVKVAQLAGYVSEQSAYHHGEASLTQTIISMAQNYVGSNNINLLSPCGQFGTRLMGGKDAASPRYVFTKLEAITRLIFHPDDDAILEYQEDDGTPIEPTHYAPIMPMALVNGSDGIGTGWSSTIPTYNPREIVANLRRMLQGEEPLDMKPWYRGYTGEITAKTGRDASNFTVLGRIEQVDESTLVISELPVGKWTADYKGFLESVLIGSTTAAAAATGADGAPACAPFIKDFKENHTDTTVLFTVTVAPEKIAEICAEKGGLMKKFKLEGSVATSNMHLFDLNSQIRKFEG
jgi:DNA topoisomerase-2